MLFFVNSTYSHIVVFFFCFNRQHGWMPVCQHNHAYRIDIFDEIDCVIKFHRPISIIDIICPDGWWIDDHFFHTCIHIIIHSFFCQFVQIDNWLVKIRDGVIIVNRWSIREKKSSRMTPKVQNNKDIPNLFLICFFLFTKLVGGKFI